MHWPDSGPRKPTIPTSVFPVEQPLGFRSPDRLLGMWRYLRYTVRVRQPVHTPDLHWLPSALRGAWGGQLLRMERGGDGAASLALDTFFRLSIKRAQGTELGKPFTIQVDREDDGELTISLSLIGLAESLRDVAIEAFLVALARGIDIDMNTQIRTPLVPIVAGEGSLRPCKADRFERIEPLTSAGPMTLRFITPCKRQTSWQKMFVLMAQRVSNLAPWQGFECTLEPGEAETLASKVTIIDANGLLPYRWVRKGYVIEGVVGNLIVGPLPDRLCPIVAICSEMSFGERAALGAGRFSIDFG